MRQCAPARARAHTHTHTHTHSHTHIRLRADSTGKQRGLHPGGTPGGYRAVVSSIKVNGQNVAWRLETGKTQEMVGNMSVHFADHKHPHDPSDGERWRE